MKQLETRFSARFQWYAVSAIKVILFLTCFALTNRALAVVATDQIYWTDGTADKVQRSNLDGDRIDDLVNGLDIPPEMVIDPLGNKMYWVDFKAGKSVGAVASWVGGGQRGTQLILLIPK